ncbi:MAG: helix-turn-helix domain-containing protein [Eubacteriales bacterium]|nr:helix-turn-helix domain-containing protein [Eubacteriales bacterium]
MKKQMLCYSVVRPIAAPATAKLLYLFLRDNVDKYGELTIRKNDLARTLGVSPCTISKNMRRLEEQGYIYIVPTYNNDGGRSANKYILRR